MALCKLQAIFSVTTVLQSEVEKKRRDFCARQGMVKQRPADVLAYVEDTRRSHDAVWCKKIKFFSESLILAQDERWRRA